jgi:hypothetical protein
VGSTPISRAKLNIFIFAVVAQLVEHDIGNIEVIGSIPINGSRRIPLLLSEEECPKGEVVIKELPPLTPP